MRLAKAAELIETHIQETFSFYAFPDQHWLSVGTFIRDATTAFVADSSRLK
jgi:hypothetical protein